MFGEFQALALVVRRDVLTVELGRRRGHAFIDEAAHGLAVFEDEGAFVAAHFQHAARRHAVAQLLRLALLPTSYFRHPTYNSGLTAHDA